MLRLLVGLAFIPVPAACSAFGGDEYSYYQCKALVSGPAGDISITGDVAGPARPLSVVWSLSFERSRGDTTQPFSRPAGAIFYYDAPEADVLRMKLDYLTVVVTRPNDRPCPTRAEIQAPEGPAHAFDPLVTCEAASAVAHIRVISRSSAAAQAFLDKFDARGRAVVVAYDGSSELGPYILDVSDVDARNKQLAEALALFRKMRVRPADYQYSLSSALNGYEPATYCYDPEEFIRMVS